MRTIILTGANGQIGYELAHSLRGLGKLVALGRAEMDLSNLQQVRGTIRSIQPDLIINAAAYTNVERAELEPDLAMRINAEAPAVMAEEARRSGAGLLHFSSDYVFDGEKKTPYTEDDPVRPLNAYGRSKAAGESAIRDAQVPHLIIRTSWVYGLRGTNFLLKLLTMAKEQEELRIVDDQYGSPTWSRTIAGACASILSRWAATSYIAKSEEDAWWLTNSGTYHVSSLGSTSWYGFAKAISAYFNEPLISVSPIASVNYFGKARRPSNSALDCAKFGKAFYVLPKWQDALRDFHVHWQRSVHKKN